MELAHARPVPVEESTWGSPLGGFPSIGTETSVFVAEVFPATGARTGALEITVGLTHSPVEEAACERRAAWAEHPAHVSAMRWLTPMSLAAENLSIGRVELKLAQLVLERRRTVEADSHATAHADVPPSPFLSLATRKEAQSGRVHSVWKPWVIS